MSRQRGAALLVALLVVALSVLLVAGLLDQGERQRARLGDALRAEQGWQLAAGLEAWAAEALAGGGALAIDTLDDPWLQPMPPIDVPGGRLGGRLHDLGGCFDLNRLAPGGVADLEAVAAFQRVLTGLGLDPQIAVEAADWVDADLEPLPGGAEDAAYAGAQPPHRTANRPMAHASELRSLRRVDQAAWSRLREVVCALPEPHPVNLNTAAPVVWLALDPRIDRATAQRLARGPGRAFGSREALIQALQREGLDDVRLEGFGLSTRFFVADAEIESDGVRYRFSSLLDNDRAAGEVRVHARVRGGW